MSSSLWLHELHHTRLPCPSLAPWVCSDSSPWSQWCYPTFSSSVTCLFLLLSVFPSIRVFSIQSTLHQVTKILELQLQHQSFQWIFGVDFLRDWLVWSPYCPRDSQESSPAPQLESIKSGFFMVQLSHPNMTTRKTTALTIWTFFDYTLSRFVLEDLRVWQRRQQNISWHTAGRSSVQMNRR